MLKPFRLLIWVSIALAIRSPQAAFGFSSLWVAQLPTLQPPPPPPSVRGSSEDVPVCYMRLSGSTVNLHQLCGMAPNQASPTTNTTGTPNVSNRPSPSVSSALGSNQSAPVSFGTGSAYADDGRR